MYLNWRKKKGREGETVDGFGRRKEK